jgi:mono/diheme cytochrome c family protein
MTRKTFDFAFRRKDDCTAERPSGHLRERDLSGFVRIGLLRFTGIFVAAASLAGASPYDAINQYCANCHNERLKTGGLVLTGLDASHAERNAEVWEKVIRKLRTSAMPPQGMPQPDAATRWGLIAGLEGQLDRAAAANPNPGRPGLHRLNRAEYGNAIRDLLALDVDAAELLPPDDSAYGFDNISDALGVSPALQEQYLSAALKLGALAVGDPHTTPGSETFRVRQDLSQNQHIEGMPVGTVGGSRFQYNFPLDAEYVLQAKLYRTNLDITRGLEVAHQFEFSIDGKRVYLTNLGGPKDLSSLFENPHDTGDAVDARLRVRVPVKAGPHEVVAGFLEGPEMIVPDRLQPYLRSSVDNFDWGGLPHIQTLAITGPFDAKGPGDTPSRRRIFVCHPANAAAEEPCAKQILGLLARRAYRQPVADSDMRTLMSFYESGRRDGGFEAGIEAGLQRILASPKFVFRVERAPGSDVELASRLSFFLWSSIPDDELLNAGIAGRLSDPAVLEREVRRMLADPKADAFVSNFAGQWLRLRNVTNILPNSDLFPDFDDNLREAFRKETELLFASVMREDRNVLDLMNADYTFVNERLARHYGIPNVYGSRFRRVTVTDDARRGLLGQGSILATTSHAERTSPVVRGKWVLENIVGAAVPPPPPDVPLLKGNVEGEKPKSMREQMSEHRANPACATCHKVMDPIGFAMENFDAVGAWRTQDASGPIDASGALADGTEVNGVVDLRRALLAHPELFVSTLTEKMLTYALGRGVGYSDMPVVRGIVRDSSSRDYRFTAIVLGIVRSAPFQMRIQSSVL